MKKSLLAAAILAAAFAAPAMAQVTIFGIVDASVRNVDNGSTNRSSLASGGLAPSRLGFKGTEDLDSDLTASFHLEHGFESDTGAQTDTMFWSRRSTVSLTSATYGEVRLGRDFVPTYVANSTFDPFGATGIGSLNSMVDVFGAGTKVRASNQAQWFSPSFSGFSGSVSVAASEGVVGAKYTGGRLAYASGPLAVQVAYGVTEMGANDFSQAVVGASYDLGYATVQGSVINGKRGSNDQKTYTVGSLVPFGVGTFRASFIHADNSGSNNANMLALGYVHNLSKRTAVYGTYALIVNDSGSARTLAAPSPVAGDKSQGVELGIKHSF